jgi:carbonic anhydrase
MLPQNRWTKSVLAALALAVVLGGVAYWRAGPTKPLYARPAPTDPHAALDELRSGNARFVKSARTLSADTAHDAEHRRRTAKGQDPFAAVLCCADSRICPEFIFDQRAGSIFEIRNAGNVVDEDVLASFEYAIEHLHVPLILVLGHKGCGAIHAVCEAGEKPLRGNLQELQKHMQGIRQQMVDNHENHTPELLDRFCKENARQQALTLLHGSRVLKSAVEKGQAQLLCGIYDMETGAADFFEPR